MTPKLYINNVNLEEKYHLYLTSFNPEFPKPRRYTIDVTGANGKLDYTDLYGAITYDNRTIKATLSAQYTYDGYHSIDDYFNSINGHMIEISVSNSSYFYKGSLQIIKFDTDLKTIDIELSVDADPTNYKKGA